MADDKTVTIKLEADTSDVEKSLKDVEKASTNMAKKVEQSGNKVEKSFNDVEKSLKDTKKQMESLTKNVNFNSLANSMKKALSNITQQVSNTTKQVKNQLQEALNIKANVEIDAKTTTDKSGGASSGLLGGMAIGGLTGGAIGSQIAKQLSLAKKEASGIAKELGRVKIIDDISLSASTMADSFNQMLYYIRENGNEAFTLGEVIDVMNDYAKETITVLQKEKVTMEDLAESYATLLVTAHDFGGTILPERDMNSMAKLLEMFQKFNDKAKELGVSITDYSDDIAPKELVQELLRMGQSLAQATQGFNKFKIIAIDGLLTLREKIGETAQSISNGLSKAFPKATTSLNKFKSKLSDMIPSSVKTKITTFGNTLKKSFSDGFKNSGKYIDQMKTKIKDWANKHKQATDKVKKANNSVASSFKGLINSMLPFITLYGAFNLIKTSVTEAMDAIETGSKFSAVFGSETEDMDKWINQVSKDLGLSTTSMKNYTSTMYSMGKNLGMTGEQAKTMSKDLSMLAQDMASFYNIDSDTAFDKLKSYMSGSSEVLYEFGVVATEANLQQFALTQGITKSYSAMTQAEKSMLRYQFAMQGLSAASGDLARTMDSPANRTRRLVTALGELRVALGNVVMPIWNAVLPGLIALANALTVVFNRIASVVNGILSLFGLGLSGGSSGGGSIGNAISDAVGGLSDGLSDASGGSGDLADNLADGASSAKEIAKSLMGIDEINNLTSPDSSSGGSGSSGSGGSSSGGGIGGLGDLGGLEETGASAIDSIARELTKLEKAFLDIWNHIKQGFMVFKDDIIKEWSKLKINIDKLGKAMSDFFVACWEHGLDKTAILIGGIVGSVVVTALRIANSVTEVVTGLFEHLNPNNNEHTQKFIDALNNLLLQIQGFIIDVGKWFSQFNEKAQPFYNNLADIAMIVGTILMQALADAIQAVRDFMNSWVGQKLIEGVAKALEWFTDIIEECLSFIRDHQDVFEALVLGIMGAYGAFKLISGAITLFNGIATICSGVCGILGGVIAFLTSPIGLVVLAIGALIAIGVLLYKNWDTIKEKCAELWQGLQTYWGYIKQLVINKCTEIKDKAIEIWNNIINSIKEFVKNLWQGLQTYWEYIKSTVVNKCTEIKNKAVEIWNNIKTSVSNTVTNIKTTIQTKFTEAKTKALEIFDNIKKGIKEKIEYARDKVEEAIEKIKGFFKFEWKLPEIKLPHFKISGEFSLMPPKVPSFGVKFALLCGNI